jgi:L-ascorbate metabolism protein UlaG (beta-lactamase superfamily)
MPTPDASSDGVAYIGHATTIIEVAGTRLLTDPLLRNRVGHVRRIAAPAPPASALRVDAVLISHVHHDHLDVPSLRRLPRDVPLVAARGTARLMGRRLRRELFECEPGERVRIGTVDVVGTEAVHDTRRLPLGRRVPPVGYLVEGTSRVYFAGDTDLFEGMRALSADLDAALLPVWGWGARVPAGHMDPERAAQAAALLRPRVAIPIHWGAFAGPRVWWRDDPELPARTFERLAAAHAPAVTVRILAPGEGLALDTLRTAAYL